MNPFRTEDQADRDSITNLRKQELNNKIAQGLDSLSRGEGIDGDEFFNKLEQLDTGFEQSPLPKKLKK